MRDAPRMDSVPAEHKASAPSTPLCRTGTGSLSSTAGMYITVTMRR